MLRRVRLRDFKSFSDQEVAVAPLTLLVGANASGWRHGQDKQVAKEEEDHVRRRDA